MKERMIWTVALPIAAMLCLCGCGTNSYLQTEETEDVSEAEASQQAEANEADGSETSSAQLYVQVSGAVECPGVYAFPEGSRVYEAIARAGGLTEDAYDVELNQAQLLTDGQKIYVPVVGEAVTVSQNGSAGLSDDGRININTATVEELMTLTGIGETRAKSIVAYRDAHGPFAAPEDLQQVSGIGESTYRKIADAITIY